MRKKTTKKVKKNKPTTRKNTTKKRKQIKTKRMSKETALTITVSQNGNVEISPGKAGAKSKAAKKPAKQEPAATVKPPTTLKEKKVPKKQPAKKAEAEANAKAKEEAKAEAKKKEPGSRHRCGKKCEMGCVLLKEEAYKIGNVIIYTDGTDSKGQKFTTAELALQFHSMIETTRGKGKKVKFAVEEAAPSAPSSSSSLSQPSSSASSSYSLSPAQIQPFVPQSLKFGDFPSQTPIVKAPPNQRTPPSQRKNPQASKFLKYNIGGLKIYSDGSTSGGGQFANAEIALAACKVDNTGWQ